MAELGQTTDPQQLVPGDPDGLRAVAAEWKERAGLADQTSAALHSSPTPEWWTGASADAYQARLQRVSARWAVVADASMAAATALDTFASTLTWAQSQAASAIQKWARGQQLSADALTAPRLAGPIELPSPMDPGSPLREEARQLLALARERVSTAGDGAASSIRAAGEEQHLDPDVWEALSVVTSTPEEALTLIGSMDDEDIGPLLSLRPELAGLIATAAAPAVASWWNKLGDEQRAVLVGALSRTIGNLEGVLYEDRDEANRIWLDEQVDMAKAELEAAKAADKPSWDDVGATSAYYDQIEAVEARLVALENVNEALTVSDNRYLVSLTADSPPLAAISIGNPDTADNLTVAVPGMNATTASMIDWAASADQLQREQTLYDPNRSHAVVAWIGYETPTPGPSVLGTELAEAGATNLGVTLEGLESVRGATDINVVAHSYGTTTASIALTQPDVHVDAFVSVGSAGLPPDIDQASDLHADEVYAGQARDVMEVDPADGDQWAWVGRDFGNHPINPVSDSFGATAFGADGGSTGRAVLDHATSTPDGTGYLNQGTESLRNVALATTGSGDRVSPYVAPEPTPFQRGLMGGNGYGSF